MALETIYPCYSKLDIARFLSECNLYDSRSKQWTRVMSEVRRSAQETVLHTPLCNIIQAIFSYFDHGKPSHRWIQDTHETSMFYYNGDEVRHYELQKDGNYAPVALKTSPDLSILGRGLDFCSTQNIAITEYTHCLAPLEVKTEISFKLEEAEALDQVKLYASQCFIHQAHRRYVPTVILTETHAMLRVYDRSGVLSPGTPVNYHTDPITFVRIILGISSITGKLESSPFDPRVSWEKEGALYPVIKIAKPVDNKVQTRTLRSSNRPDYNKVQARTLRSSNLKPDCYEVTEPPWNRRSISGRGTVCWRALKVDDGKPRTEWSSVFVKNYWRYPERQNEWELLNEVKGLAGVGQIIAYEDDTEQPISVLRNHVVKGLYDTDKNPYKSDRIFCRLVLETYGQSIKRFQTKLQLLHAFYDAVAGHKCMWMEKKILHRDISVENILLGKKDAEKGNRGILIDLDMAIKVDRKINLSGGQFRTGTRAYQSYSVLKSQEWAPFSSKGPPHDHLDDLESFFYVLAWICMKYDGPGNSKRVPDLDLWELDNANVCASTKLNYLLQPLNALQPYFQVDETICTLISSLATLCEEHVRSKIKIVGINKKEVPNLQAVYNLPNASSGKDHDRFLTIIQSAIDALELRPPEAPRTPPTHAAAPAADSPGRCKVADSSRELAKPFQKNNISVVRNNAVIALYEADTPCKPGRIYRQTVLQDHRVSVRYFQTKLQLLHAFYDAVAGHKRNWMENMVLHRDISVENILLGNQDAEKGNRGILIDLDMAIKVDRETNLSGPCQFRTGTRAFQSFAVLSSARWANYPSDSPPHDHLDDLESFFYVLAWICIKYERPGKSISVATLNRWEHDDVEQSADVKYRYVSEPLNDVQPYFAKDETMSTLLVSLAQLCQEHIVQKQRLANRRREKFPNLMTVYHASSGKDHDDFLEIVQTAITALELRDPEKPYSPATDTAPVVGPSGETADGPSELKTPHKNRGADNKRKTQDSNEEEPLQRKRTRGLSEKGSRSAPPQAPLLRTRSQTRVSTSKK